VFSGPALSADDAESLVRRYNERLRDRLREPEPDDRIQVRRGLRPELHLAPWIAQGSGGLAVAARF
jgi:hypothetical protein